MSNYNKIVLERDNYTCQNPDCEHKKPGCKKMYILDNPHHIKFKGQGGLDKPENRITLCRTCHDKVHGRTKVEGMTGREYMNWILEQEEVAV